MDLDIAKKNIALRLGKHEERLEYNPALASAASTLNLLLDVMELVGWPASRQAPISEEVPRRGQCLGYCDAAGMPHLFVVAEPHEKLGTPPEMHDEAARLGYQFLVASNGRDWKFVDLGTRKMVCLRDMIWTREADRALRALSCSEAAPSHFRELLAYAHVLEYGEEAVRRLLDGDPESLMPFLLAIAKERQELHNEGRVRDMLLSGVSSIDMLLGAPTTIKPIKASLDVLPEARLDNGLFGDIGEETADRAEQPRKRRKPTPPAVPFEPKGRVYVGRSTTFGSLKFELVAHSARKCTLKAGSQIILEVSEITANGEARPEDTFVAHNEVVTKGEAVAGVTEDNTPCLVLTKDVPNLAPSRALKAIYGTQRNANYALADRETGLAWNLMPELETAQAADVETTGTNEDMLA